MKRFVLFAWVLALWSAPAFGQEVILTQVSDHAEETLVAGEAWVVADPRDPQTVVVIWLATLSADEATNPGTPPLGYCGIGRSTDGGRNWSTRIAPYQNSTVPRTVPICGDPAGVVLPDGAIVLTAVQLGSPNEFVQSITSFDGGQTWSTPSAPFGARPTLAAALANQSVPDLGPGRQWMAVDPITGEVSIQSQVDVATTGRQLTVSTDRGFTWSAPRNVGSTSLGPIGAAYGVVAGAYDSGANKIFQTSTDHGLSWVRNVMPVGTGAGRAYTAADPTTRGRFAVLLARGSNTLEVWITTDAGRTAAKWTQAKVFTPESGDTFSRPWIAFSPTGALGVVWRSHNADGSYDVDAVVSRDGGAHFDAPVRLTAARGPSPNGQLGSDDCACNLHLTGTTLSTTWGDWTTGNRELWFGSFDYTTP
jgi:hypothetical protein